MTRDEWLGKHLEDIQDTIWIKEIDIREIQFIMKSVPNLSPTEIKDLNDREQQANIQRLILERRKLVVMKELHPLR